MRGRFDRNRRDMFRYALFAHAVGLPKEPCLKADGSVECAVPADTPDFKVPVTNSGIADFPGGDLHGDARRASTTDDASAGWDAVHAGVDDGARAGGTRSS